MDRYKDPWDNAKQQPAESHPFPKRGGSLFASRHKEPVPQQSSGTNPNQVTRPVPGQADRSPDPICDQIGGFLHVHNGTVGKSYELTIDLDNIIKDQKLTFWGEGVKLEEGVATPSFEAVGLKYELISPTVVKISGTPSKGFFGKLIFRVSSVPEEGESDHKKVQQVTLTRYQIPKPFVINAAPRSLWNDLPVENYEGYDNDTESLRSETEKYANGEPVVLGLANGETVEYIPAKTDGTDVTTPAREFEVIAASARGRSHAHNGKPRDDAFHFEFDKETGWNFVAVADGAGSAIYSRKGSELATKSVIKKLRAILTKESDTIFRTMIQQLEFSQPESKTQWNLPSEKENEFVKKTEIGVALQSAVYMACEVINKECQKRRAILKNYNTTLLCAAFRWFPELYAGKGGWFIASYWIGDGGAAIIRPAVENQPETPEERVLVLGKPDVGEYSGQTRFLNRDEAVSEEKFLARCRFSFCDSFDAMLFMTDGITDPFFPSEVAVAECTRWNFTKINSKMAL